MRIWQKKLILLGKLLENTIYKRLGNQIVGKLIIALKRNIPKILLTEQETQHINMEIQVKTIKQTVKRAIIRIIEDVVGVTQNMRRMMSIVINVERKYIIMMV
jgi:formate/nitrite transporter FocA (FNT family)